jgi:hypothetical protein
VNFSIHLLLFLSVLILVGDYDRALMLLWDALRIRKIASEPLKISATLRLLADLHFSKEENVSCLAFFDDGIPFYSAQNV